MAYISGIGTAAPVTRYSQRRCWEALQDAPQFEALTRGARGMLQRVLCGDSGIDARALALDPLSEAFEVTPDALHARFARHAPLLAQRAATRALEDCGLAAGDIDAIVVSTCTGYLCPGLTSYVIEALGLRNDVVALDLVGQGCGAAIPNLATADALIEAGRCAAALSICVEVCSAAFYLDEDAGVLVSACLFGDGAGAAVLTREPSATRPALRLAATASLHDPGERDALRFEHRGGLLRNILTPRVPALAAASANSVCDAMLTRRGLTRDDIVAWIWHAGGKRVLDEVEGVFGLSAQHTQASRDVLRDYGNVSSAFVYFVLERAWRAGGNPGWWWMSAFGAGFSCHGALIACEATSA